MSASMLPFTKKEAHLVRNLILRLREALQSDGTLVWDENFDREFQHVAEVSLDAGPGPAAFFKAKERVHTMLREATELQIVYGQALGRLVFIMENLFRLAGDCIDEQYVNIFGGKAVACRIVAVMDHGGKDEIALRFWSKSSDGDSEPHTLQEIAEHLRTVSPHKSIRLLYLADALAEEVSRFKLRRSRAQTQIKKLVTEHESVSMTMHISADENDGTMADHLTEMLREIKIAVVKPLPNYANYKTLNGSLSGCLPFHSRRRDPRYFPTKEKMVLLQKQQKSSTVASSLNVLQSKSVDSAPPDLHPHHQPRPQQPPKPQQQPPQQPPQQQQQPPLQQEQSEEQPQQPRQPVQPQQQPEQEKNEQPLPTLAQSSDVKDPQQGELQQRNVSQQTDQIIADADNTIKNNAPKLPAVNRQPDRINRPRWNRPCVIDLPTRPKGWRILYKPAGMETKELVAWWIDKDPAGLVWSSPMGENHSGLVFVSSDMVVPPLVRRLISTRSFIYEFVALVDASVRDNYEIAAPNDYSMRFGPLLELRRKRGGGAICTFIIGSFSGSPDRLGIALQHARVPVAKIDGEERVHFFGVSVLPTVKHEPCMRLRHWLCPIPQTFFSRLPTNMDMEKGALHIAQVAVTDWDRMDLSGLPCSNNNNAVGRVVQLSPFGDYWNDALHPTPHARCFGAVAVSEEPVDFLLAVKNLTRNTVIPCRSRIGWLPDYEKIRHQLTLGSAVAFAEHRPLASPFPS